MDAKIVDVSERVVTVLEQSGITSTYPTWDAFLSRPDSADLCTNYVNSLAHKCKIVIYRATAV